MSQYRPTGFHHVQLAIPPGGEDEGRRFYGEAVGLDEVEKPEPLRSRGGCWFRSRDGSVEVHLGVEADFRPARKAHPAILVAGLEELRARLDAAGAEVRVDVQLESHRRFHAFDPFGNRLEFLERQT